MNCLFPFLNFSTKIYDNIDNNKSLSQYYYLKNIRNNIQQSELSSFNLDPINGIISYELCISIKNALFIFFINKLIKNKNDKLIKFEEYYQKQDSYLNFFNLEKINKICTTKLCNIIINNINHIDKYYIMSNDETSFLVIQISYFIFFKLIKPNDKCNIQIATINNLTNLFEINFNFDEDEINQFNTHFFVKNNDVIDIENEENKELHEYCNIKLTNKIIEIIKNPNFNDYVIEIINSNKIFFNSKSYIPHFKEEILNELNKEED